MTFTKAKYPGDSILIAVFRNGDDIGQIRIQQYEKNYRVGTFLPGVYICLPGDTPKVEPERHQWCNTPGEAELLFNIYKKFALAHGWVEI